MIGVRCYEVPTVLAQIEFARKAADHFLAHPNHWTYSDGQVEFGDLFAVRWGADPMRAHAVLVIRVDDAFIVGDLDHDRDARVPKAEQVVDVGHDCPHCGRADYRETTGKGGLK